MTTSISWKLFTKVTEVERTLPDCVIEPASLLDWQAVLDCVREQRWQVEVRSDHGTTDTLPRDASALFPGGDERVTLAVWPDPRVQLNFFALETSSIDFDFDTAEIQGEAEFDILLHALRMMARALSQTVRVSHEGASGLVFMTVSAAGDLSWTDNQ